MSNRSMQNHNHFMVQKFETQVKQSSTPSDLCLVMVQPIKPGATIIGPGLSLQVHSFYNSQEKWVRKRKKERKKPTNYERKHPYYLPFNYPVMSSGFDCAHFGCLNVSFAFTCEYDSFPALFIAPAEYHLATA